MFKRTNTTAFIAALWMLTVFIYFCFAFLFLEL